MSAMTWNESYKRGHKQYHLRYREPVVSFVLCLIAIMSKAEGLSPTLPLIPHSYSLGLLSITVRMAWWLKEEQKQENKQCFL